MAAKSAHPSPHPARPALVAWGLLAIACLVLTSCRPSPPPQAETTPAPPETSTPETLAPEASTPASPGAEPTVAPAPVATSAPTTTAATTASLPDTLTREWQPLSNVLLAFGPMTLTANQVQWGSGQASAYSLVSTEGGYLLKLEAPPSFYDTPSTYIKLIPKADASGTPTSIDVAFYTDEGKLQSDDYVMFGGYFAE